MTVPWVPSDDTLRWLITNGVNTVPEIIDYLEPELCYIDRSMFRDKTANKLMRLRRRGIVRRAGMRITQHGKRATIWEWCA